MQEPDWATEANVHFDVCTYCHGRGTAECKGHTVSLSFHPEVIDRSQKTRAAGRSLSALRLPTLRLSSERSWKVPGMEGAAGPSLPGPPGCFCPLIVLPPSGGTPSLRHWPKLDKEAPLGSTQPRRTFWEFCFWYSASRTALASHEGRRNSPSQSSPCVPNRLSSGPPGEGRDVPRVTVVQGWGSLEMRKQEATLPC